MKNTIILLFLAITFFYSCNEKSEQTIDYVIIKGQIESNTNEKIIIRDNNWIPIDTILVQNKTFNDTLRVPKGYYYLSYNETDAHLYIKPNFNISVNLNNSDFSNSLNYKGNGAIENNYLAKKDRLTQSIPMTKRAYSFYAKLNESEFLKQNDSINNLYFDLFNQSAELDDDFKLIEYQAIKIDNALKLAQFEGQKRLIDKNPEFKISENYPNPFKDIDLNNPLLLSTYRYKKLVHSFINEKSMGLIKNNDSLDFFIVYQNELSKSKLNPEIKDLLGYENAEFGFTYTSNKEEYRNSYLSFAKTQDYIDKFNKLYNATLSEKGKQSANFVLESIDGKEYELTDFKDKYVYIDLWATWCSPCIAQIPHLKKLEEKYNEKIYFISIAWNDNKTKWMNMIREKDLNGIQLFASDKNAEFFKFYEVNGLPRFILLDKQGKIIESNAKQPSEPSLDIQLENLE